jgi:hypothetical protein
MIYLSVWHGDEENKVKEGTCPAQKTRLELRLEMSDKTRFTATQHRLIA